MTPEPLSLARSRAHRQAAGQVEVLGDRIAAQRDQLRPRAPVARDKHVRAAPARLLAPNLCLASNLWHVIWC